MSFRVVLSFAFLSIGLMSCSMPDDVKAAKDTSQQMNDKLTTSIDGTDTLVDRTSNLFAGARKDLGFERVEGRFEDVLNKTADTSKILAATALATSFEFQQWTGTKSDNLKLKEHMYAKAMRDLLTRIEPLVNHMSTPDLHILGLPFLPDLPNNSWKSLASIAVALGEIDQDQALASAKQGVRAESLYSLIVKGLQYKKKSLFVTIPEFAEEVLTMEDEAVMMLQMRHIYFQAMVLSRFSDFCAGVTGGEYKRLMEMFSWVKSQAGWPVQIKYASNIIKVQNEAVLWLQQARETQQVLQKLGYPIQSYAGIQDVFKKVKFTKPNNWAGYPMVEKTYSELNEVMSDLKSTYITKKAANVDLPKSLAEPKALLSDEELDFVSKQGLTP